MRVVLLIEYVSAINFMLRIENQKNHSFQKTSGTGRYMLHILGCNGPTNMLKNFFPECFCS